MPWNDDRLDAVETAARQCTSGDACSIDVVLLVAEVRRLREVVRQLTATISKGGQSVG